jgi:hypothetical protein
MTPPADRLARLRAWYGESGSVSRRRAFQTPLQMAADIEWCLDTLALADALAAAVENSGESRPRQARWDVVQSAARAYRAAREGAG